MMGWYGDGMGWAGWLMMVTVMIAFWGLVVFAGIALFRGTSRDSGRVDRAAQPDPRHVLDERFARGEIDADEYHARQAVLRDSRP
ncbi:MAG: hypothetical protein LH477_07160 [Nocardioides sp.]|nr:hypothetical protein [Nocardioides sp.]